MSLHPEPRYRIIEQALRARIASAQPGQRLPSDADLCAEFGVSRMTARQAMAQLAEEGLILRDPGRGTFVAEPPTHRRANFLMAFSHEMRRQGRTPSSRIIERRLRPPTEAERVALRVPRGVQVVALRRVRLADREPVAIELAVLVGRCGEPVLAADLEAGSLHEALAAVGILPSHGMSSIRAEAATAEDARLLGIGRGTPMLVERRTILDQRGRPIEHTESRYAAERYGLDVRFAVEDAGSIRISQEGGEHGFT